MPTFRYFSLAESIVIKAFIQIIQRVNLCIEVGDQLVPIKHPYQAYYFEGKDKSIL
jgi:hypothetical protein